MNQVLKRIVRFSLSLALISILIYALIVAYFYLNQGHLLFQNTHIIQKPNIEKITIQDVRIKTKDGETIQAWYEAAQSGRPTILFFHGNATILEMSKWRYLRMHKQGVGYLAMAYRGYSESSGVPNEKGVYIDGLSAFDWLVENGVKPNEIVIHGHSLGTGVASYVAKNRPARALILESPFTSATDAAKAHYPFLPVDLMMKNRFESKNRIKEIKMPILIAHGTRDVVIPFSQGKALYELANQPKEFIIMKDGDHNTLTRDGVYDYYWKFLGLSPKDYAPNLKIKE